MKMILILAILAGLAIGPAYWIYGKFYSGQTVQVLELLAADNGRFVSGEFRIDPAMAPLGLIMTASGYFTPNMTEDQPPKDIWSATLSRNSSPLHSVEFQLSAGTTGNTQPVFKEHLFLLQVAEAGDYQLELAPKAEPKMALSNLHLAIKTGLLEPDANIVSVGMALLIVAGLVLFLL